jgi:hypothetical protein
VHSAALPEELLTYLTQLESQLLSFGSQPTVNENAMDGDNNNIINNNIKGMLSITSMAQKLLRAGASLGGDAFLCVLCRLLRAVVVRFEFLLLEHLIFLYFYLWCVPCGTRNLSLYSSCLHPIAHTHLE